MREFEISGVITKKISAISVDEAVKIFMHLIDSGNLDITLTVNESDIIVDPFIQE